MTEAMAAEIEKLIERWRPVRGFEDRYEVSDRGRIRAVGYLYLLSVTPPPSRPKDYASISLRKNGHRERRYVHRVVADAFLPKQPTSKHEIRHLDGNRSNNAASNLAWGTRQENADDRDRHGNTAKGARHGMYGVRTFGHTNANASLTETQANRIRELAGKKSQRAIAREVGTSQRTVWAVVNGKSYPAALRALSHKGKIQ